MRQQLEEIGHGYTWYKIRRPEFERDDVLPFRVSPEPLVLQEQEIADVRAIGEAVTSYFKTVDELYRQDGTVRELLDTGKPEILLADKETNYLFVRPDLIITKNGFTMCEVETSPFGLALTQLFAKGYEQEGHEVLVSSDTLPNYVEKQTPQEGVLVYSNKTKSYGGQLSFLADHVFKREWRTEQVNGQIDTTVYRGFYQSEYMEDPEVVQLMHKHLHDKSVDFIPSLTPHLEEKAVLTFLYDRRFEDRIRKTIGDSAFNVLRNTVPHTWIVGQEEYFSPGVPAGVTTAVDLATLSRSKRAFVLKTSGFGKDASWAEGVHFIGELSREKAEAVLTHAVTDTSKLHVIQAFEKPIERPMRYEENSHTVPMNARIRLTPYYGLEGEQEGHLVAIKATGCENTDRLHAATNSINTAVSYDRHRSY